MLSLFVFALFPKSERIGSRGFQSDTDTEQRRFDNDRSVRRTSAQRRRRRRRVGKERTRGSHLLQIVHVIGVDGRFRRRRRRRGGTVNRRRRADRRRRCRCPGRRRSQAAPKQQTGVIVVGDRRRQPGRVDRRENGSDGTSTTGSRRDTSVRVQRETVQSAGSDDRVAARRQGDAETSERSPRGLPKRQVTDIRSPQYRVAIALLILILWRRNKRKTA